MKHILKTSFLLILLTITGICEATETSAGNHTNAYTLYPPLNFTGSVIECNGYLQWQKPQLPGGATPAGLLGYYIYRDGTMVFYVPGGENLFFYDYNLEYATYTYTITANYDLTTYGVPGQFGESTPAGPVSVFINCSMGMPFYEPWDVGTFAFQNWQFSPAQGNWTINTLQGNPAPAAFFTGTPAVQNYEVTLKSTLLPCEPWVCADIYLEFDYQLTDLAAGGTEKLIVEYFTENTWFPVVEIQNEGSTGWVHQKSDISLAGGNSCRLGFKVSGTNSANISSWAVDNIRLTPVCKGPGGCNYTKSGNVVHLFWQPPPCSNPMLFAGYNVFRTLNATGEPPFVKLNSSLIQSMEYDDAIPSTILNAHYRYVVTCVQKNLATNDVLCEAPCDTLVVDYISGIAKKDLTSLQINLNTVSGKITVQSGSPVEQCELYNCMGQLIKTIPGEKREEITIPVSTLPSGIYLVSIKNASGTFVRKVTLMH
jgi:hypothetical protein